MYNTTSMQIGDSLIIPGTGSAATTIMKFTDEYVMVSGYVGCMSRINRNYIYEISNESKTEALSSPWIELPCYSSLKTAYQQDRCYQLDPRHVWGSIKFED
jgi:hypothetical protein